jgi:HEAT repeat protein
MPSEQQVNRLRYGSPLLRADAARELGISKDPSAIPLLIQALGDREYEVRAAAAEALTHFREQAVTAVSKLSELLHDKAWPVRKEAAIALGLMNDERAVKPLIRLVNDGRVQPKGDTQHRTIVEALIALGRLRSVKATDVMVKILKKGYAEAPTDWQIQIRQAAAYGLGFLDQPEGTQALIDTAREDERPEVRESVVTALCMSKSEASFKLMLESLPFKPFEDITKVWRRQEAILLALGERGDRRAVPHIVALNNSEYPEVRQALVTTLLRLGETQNSEVLMDLLRDRMPEVRAAAASALGHLQITEAAGALEVVALDPDQRVSVAATTALESIKQLTAGTPDSRFLPSASSSGGENNDNG